MITTTIRTAKHSASRIAALLPIVEAAHARYWHSVEEDPPIALDAARWAYEQVLAEVAIQLGLGERPFGPNPPAELRRLLARAPQ